MNRVPPERVTAAYEKTGLIATQDVWVRKWDSGHCEACGLSAVMIADGKATLDELLAIVDDKESDAEPNAARALDLDPSYERGFVHGFDAPEGKPAPWRSEDEEYQLGFKDGQAAALAVFGEH